MYLFTPESQDRLNDIWDGHLSHDYAGHVIRFMTDLECGYDDNYRWERLQTGADRRVYYLPPPGFVVIVDWYPPDGAGGEWTLDLVNAFHDSDFEDLGPWQLP